MIRLGGINVQAIAALWLLGLGLWTWADEPSVAPAAPKGEPAAPEAVLPFAPASEASLFFGPHLPPLPAEARTHWLNRPIHPWTLGDVFTPPPAGIHRSLPVVSAPMRESIAAELPSMPSPHPKPLPALPQTGALEMREILQSVERSFPLLLAITQEREIASGQRVAAEGAFDLHLRARSTTIPEGTYPNRRVDLAFEQSTPLYGISYFAGYRLGRGDFPSYSGGQVTAQGGEFRAGLVVPLLRGGPIDRQRALLRQAQIAEDLANPTIQRARIDFLRAAARAYWNWVARGEQYLVAEDILRLAVERQKILEEQLRQGAGNQVNVVDNRRILAERQGILANAERLFQQASFDLSLFLRDAEGLPQVPGADRLPRHFRVMTPKPLPPGQLKKDITLAQQWRPELQRFPLLRERAAVELRLAENALYPALHLSMSGSQDVGLAGSGLDRSNWDITMVLDVPLQRREAQGRAQAARALLLQLAAQEQFARDQIIADVQNAHADLDRTLQRWLQAQHEQKEAEEVLKLELERMKLGGLDLFVVNIREQQAANAVLRVIDALADFYRAEADYRAALGLDSIPTSPR